MPTKDFAGLLNKYMERDRVGEAHVSNLTKERFGEIFQVPRSTIRNWRSRGESNRDFNWRQLAAVASVLHLSTTEADSLFKEAQLSGLEELWAQANEDEEKLLQRWARIFPIEKFQKDLTDLHQKADQLIENVSKITQPAKIPEVTNAFDSVPFILPPLDIPYFTGREAELKQLEDLLLNADGPPIAGLTGTGGMGKSALAFHFADKYRDRFPDGVIGLRVDNEQIDVLARRFARLSGVSLDSKQDLRPSEIMQSIFRDKRALLIFDNVEEAIVGDLHPIKSQCAIIVTTRNRGLLDSFRIPDSKNIDLPRFQLAESIDLLNWKLGQERVASESEAAHEIHDLVGGLPLALRIVSGTLDLSGLKLANYAIMLRDEKRRLAYLQHPGNPNLDVRASFALSVKFLSFQQLSLFACLGACAPQGFSLEIVPVVSTLDEAQAILGLAKLRCLSLVDQDKISTGRFVLHPLLFLFARELAQERDLLSEAEKHYADFYIRYAHKHRGSSATDKDSLERELDALLWTARHLTKDLVVANEFYKSISLFLQMRGYWHETLALIDMFLPVARDHHDLYRISQFLLQQGKFYLLLGRVDEALQALQESRSTALQIEDIKQRQRLLAMVLNSLGGVYQRQGELEEAAQALQESHEFWAEQEDRQGLAQSLNSLGGVYQRLGKLDDAALAFQQSLDFGGEVKKHRAMVLNSLGGVYQRLGKFEEAAQVFKESYDLRVEQGDHQGQAMSLNSLGGVYQRLGKLEEAAQIFKESYDFRVKLGDRQGLAMVLNSLGGLYQKLGKLDDAALAFQQSMAIEKVLGTPHGQAVVLTSLGSIYQQLGKLDDAALAFQQSMALEKRSSNHRGQAMVLYSWGKALLYHNEPQQASEKFKASFEINERLRNTQGLRIVTSPLMHALTKLGQSEEAQEYYHRALAIAPDDKQLLKLQKQFSQQHPVTSQELLKTGRIKRVIQNSVGYLYGFVMPDDGSADIYFDKDHVAATFLPQLAEGRHVTVDIEVTARGPRARHVWQYPEKNDVL